MKLHEIKDDEPELTHGQKLMMSMIKKTMPHGLKLRRVDDWKKTHRDVEVTGVAATRAMAGNPLLQVRVNADWERPAESKVNNQLINDDDINEWTIKKQEDGTFILIHRRHIQEAANEHIFLSMLRRLDKQIKAGKVFIKLYPKDKPTRLIRFLTIDMGDEKDINVEVASPRPNDYSTWLGSISAGRMDDFEIKRVGGDGETIWMIAPRQTEVRESADEPIVVSMLSRLLANHFKKGGLPVMLNDIEWQTTGNIRGYRWNGSNLTVTIKRSNHNQEFVYPQGALDKLTLKRATHADSSVWMLTFDPSKETV